MPPPGADWVRIGPWSCEHRGRSDKQSVVGNTNKKNKPPSRTPLAKLTRPRLPAIFERPELLARLDGAAAEAPGIWIEGPPGAGKTTLVLAWLAERDSRCLWYQVDAGDRDPASFFHYLGLAVQAAAPRYRTPMPRLTPEYMRGLPTFARNFFRELARRVGAPFVLVLDNVQEAGSGGPFFEILREGLEELPAEAHVVVVSRIGPPETLARLRLNRQLALLDWNSLRLSERESIGLAEFLAGARRAQGLATTGRRAAPSMRRLARGVVADAPRRRADDGAYLTDGCCGCAAPLRLLRGRDFRPPPRRVAGFSAAHGAAVALVRRSDGEGGDRRGASGDSADRARSRAPFHSAERTVAPDVSVPSAVSRVPADAGPRDARCAGLGGAAAARGGGAEISGARDEALHVYADAGEWGAVTRLLGELAPLYAAEGRFAAIATLLARVPRPLVETEPWLSYWRGVCRQLADPSEAAAAFETAYTKFRERNDGAGAYRTWIGAVHAAIYALSNMGSVDVWIERFVALAPRVSAVSLRRHRAKPRRHALHRARLARAGSPRFPRSARECGTAVPRARGGRRVCAPRLASFC